MTVERRTKAAAETAAGFKLFNKDCIGHRDHNQYLPSGIMDDARSWNYNNSNKTPTTPSTSQGKRIEYRRSLSTQGRRRIFSASYLSFEGLFLLVCLTASLLLLPLILPPLPPPPFMLLLLLPICSLALLMILAFMPSSNARDLTSPYL